MLAFNGRRNVQGVSPTISPPGYRDSPEDSQGKFEGGKFQRNYFNLRVHNTVLFLSAQRFMLSCVSILRRSIREHLWYKSAFHFQFIRVVAPSCARRAIPRHLREAFQFRIVARTCFLHFYADRCEILREIARMCSSRGGKNFLPFPCCNKTRVYKRKASIKKSSGY